MRYVILLLILTGCGKNTLDIAPEARPYVDAFVQAGASVGRPISIEDLVVVFSPKVANDKPGICHRGAGATPTVIIDRKRWDDASKTQRELLIFHELGHCILERDHVDHRSIMQPFLMRDVEYKHDKLYYINELFT